MSDSSLPDSVVEALARLHDALPHNAVLESDLFFVRSELAKSLVVIKGQEKVILRLECEQLKNEETILHQADRVLSQHRATKSLEHELFMLRETHARLLADHNQSTVRHILARIMGKRHAKD